MSAPLVRLHLRALTLVLFGAIGAHVAAAGRSATAFPVAEPSFSAELVGIDREWNVSFKSEGKVRVMSAGELAYWGRWSDVESGPQILLSDGGVIRADVLLVDERQIVIGDATGLGRGFWEESALPRRAVSAVMLQPPAAAAQRDELFKRLIGSVGSDDCLILTGGETVVGKLVAAPQLGRFSLDEVTAGTEKFEMVPRNANQAIGIPAAKVTAVQFGKAVEDAEGKASSDMQTAIWMGLKEGSLIRALSVTTKGGVVTVGLAAGGELKTALADREEAGSRFWNSVNYLEPNNRRVVWLSDCESLGYKQIPFLSIQWPLGTDASALGTRLRAGRAVFRKGIGMPSASRVGYDVAGYRRFEAEISIDDAAGQGGSVVFKVVLQTAAGAWQKAYESPMVRGGDVAVPISVDLKGASRMALLVEFAERGDECDYANWLAARLIK